MPFVARFVSMNENRPLTRRAFLGQAATFTALGIAAPHLVAAAQPAGRPKLGANSRIHLGLIGCGGMGRANLGACASQPDIVVTGACDVWQARRDAVIIATPPHWHALIAITACEAGKDIYLQKPMSLHLGESFAVRNAVRKHDRISQVGTQIHATENYRRVVELIRAGNLGPVGAVRTFNVQNQMPDGVGHSPATPIPAGLDWELWCGPAPLCPFNPILAKDSYNHCSWLEYSGGWTPGMAPHIIDLPVWALDLGFPLKTSSVGGRYFLKDDGDAYDNHEVVWQYPNFTMTWMSSLTNSYGFDFEGDPKPQRRLGMYFHGANGSLAADYGTLKILPEGDKMKGFEAPPKSIPPSPGHEREWLDCIKSRRQPSCNVSYHVRVDVPISLSLLSLKLGRSIGFNPATERIVGDPEAARLAIPKYRAPWKFPKQYLNA